MIYYDMIHFNITYNNIICYAILHTKGRIISLRRQIKDPAEAEEWMAKGNSLQVIVLYYITLHYIM